MRADLSKLQIVTAFTEGSAYAEEARQLAASAARFGHSVRALGMPDRGDWWRNAGGKPHRLLQVMREHERPVLFLDADCRVLAPLEEMIGLLDSADLWVKYRPQMCFTTRVNSGVLLLRNSVEVQDLVATWADLASRYAHLHRFADQGMLVEAMWLHQNHVRMGRLPLRFHTTPDDVAEGAKDDCVVFHGKASRLHRHGFVPATEPAAEPKSPKRDSVPTQPIETTAPAKLFVVRPTEGYSSVDKPDPDIQRIPVAGVEGGFFDIEEYAARWGFSQPGAIDIGEAPGEPGSLDPHMLAALVELHRHLPEGTNVILAGWDVIPMRDLSPFWQPLANNDLVLAWDPTRSENVPSLDLFAARLGPNLHAKLLPAIDHEFEQLKTEIGPDVTVATAMSRVLQMRELARVACLPPQTIGEMGHTDQQAIAISVRDQLPCGITHHASHSILPNPNSRSAFSLNRQ